MVDYNALGKKAAQNQEKDSVTFDEGDTLIHLIPVDGLPGDMPYVCAQVYGKPVGDHFKRSVISYDGTLAQSPAYQAALGRDVESPCPIGVWASENLSGKEANQAKPKDVCYWAICVIATRKKSKNDWQDDYTKPKVMTAKQGSTSKPHLQSGIEIAMGELENVADLFNSDGAQLIVVNRKGTGFQGTNFSVSLASGEFDGQDLTAFAISDEMKADIASATKKGGHCDLVQYVADRFSPDHAEIREKLYGEAREGGGSSDKPEMEE